MKTMMAALALLTAAAASACGGPKIQPTNGDTGASASSPAVNGASTTGGGTGTTGSGTNTTGAYSEQTSATQGGSPPGNSNATAASTSNNVILGAQFNGAPAVSFGRIRPGQSVTLPFQLSSFSQQSITIVTLTTGDAAFSASTECEGRVLGRGTPCAFSVTFRPATTGDFNTYLKVATDPPGFGSTQTSLLGSAGPASITGQSVSAPASQVAPADGSSPSPGSSAPPTGNSSP